VFELRDSHFHKLPRWNAWRFCYRFAPPRSPGGKHACIARGSSENSQHGRRLMAYSLERNRSASVSYRFVLPCHFGFGELGFHRSRVLKVTYPRGRSKFRLCPVRVHARARHPVEYQTRVTAISRYRRGSPPCSALSSPLPPRVTS